MRVLKRCGTYEDVSFDKVLRRIRNFCDGLSHVDPHEIAQKVCSRIYDGVKTSELDELAAQMCFSMSTEHPEFGALAASIIISNHHKNTSDSYSDTVDILFNNKDIHDTPAPLVSDELYEIVQMHKKELDDAIDYKRDYAFDYFGFKTLERSYLQKVGGKSVERPQHMWMRVALGIWGWNIENALKCYNLMSQRLYTHATPTLFNAGTRMPAMSSCFLLGMHDSLQGIYKTISDSAMISKGAGGIGTWIHNVRARGSYIRGTNGQSSGLIPMLRVYNATMRHANQAGRRLGSAALYVEPWHADIFDFVALRRNTGSEEERCRDLFLAMWVPDLFMERVQANSTWSLMCPDECPGLADVFGDEFKTLYERYEREGRARKTIKAQELWAEILKSQIETGTPYILYKDACQKTNQKNLGVIKSSNLCVAPETRILIKGIDGPQDVQIVMLANKEVEVWNGTAWSLVTVLKTGENQDIINVMFSNGSIIECTRYHKFYIEGQDTPIEAQSLIPGDYLQSWVMPNGVNKSNIYVTQVEDHGRMADTYCFNEPLEHRGVFNGILTGQCAEITIYSDDKEYGVCNLASIVLPSFVTPHPDAVDSPATFDYERLHEVVKFTTRSMDRVIDRNHYPVPETKRSNMRHRPIGIGIQGLSDVFIQMRLPFDSPDALEVNRLILETMYHASLEASNEISMERAKEMERLEYLESTEAQSGLLQADIDAETRTIRKNVCVTEDEVVLGKAHPKWRGAYSTFATSPTASGTLQFDMWNVTPTQGRYDWDALKTSIKEHGIRHSLLIALMPTASTSQIMGSTESFEAITSNIYQRRTLAGEFVVVNKFLVRDLVKIGLWNRTLKDRIIAGEGSIQHITEIPEDIRALYKTVWEIRQRVIIDQAAARAPYVCQTQSMNLYVEDPDISRLTNMHFHGWRQGLKTGSYYLRTRPKAKTMTFSLDPSVSRTNVAKTTEADVAAACRRDNPEGCMMCSA